MYLSSYPNLDGTKPDEVKVFHTDPGKVTVVVMEDGVHDDSVQAIEVRADLVKNKEVWSIEWAGRRWKCGRTFFPTWTTNPCP